MNKLDLLAGKWKSQTKVPTSLGLVSIRLLNEKDLAEFRKTEKTDSELGLEAIKLLTTEEESPPGAKPAQARQFTAIDIDILTTVIAALNFIKLEKNTKDNLCSLGTGLMKRAANTAAYREHIYLVAAANRAAGTPQI